MNKDEIKLVWNSLDIEFEKLEEEIRRFKIKVDSVMDYLQAKV